jgi:hypothetical protein
MAVARAQACLIFPAYFHGAKPSSFSAGTTVPVRQRGCAGGRSALRTARFPNCAAACEGDRAGRVLLAEKRLELPTQLRHRARHFPGGTVEQRSLLLRAANRGLGLRSQHELPRVSLRWRVIHACTLQDTEDAGASTRRESSRAASTVSSPSQVAPPSVVHARCTHHTGRIQSRWCRTCGAAFMPLLSIGVGGRARRRCRSRCGARPSRAACSAWRCCCVTPRRSTRTPPIATATRRCTSQLRQTRCAACRRCPARASGAGAGGRQLPAQRRGVRAGDGVPRARAEPCRPCAAQPARADAARHCSAARVGAALPPFPPDDIAARRVCYRPPAWRATAASAPPRSARVPRGARRDVLSACSLRPSMQRRYSAVVTFLESAEAFRQGASEAVPAPGRNPNSPPVRLPASLALSAARGPQQGTLNTRRPPPSRTNRTRRVPHPVLNPKHPGGDPNARTGGAGYASVGAGHRSRRDPGPCAGLLQSVDRTRRHRNQIDRI